MIIMGRGDDRSDDAIGDNVLNVLFYVDATCVNDVLFLIKLKLRYHLSSGVTRRVGLRR